jgi:hypothetical protein
MKTETVTLYYETSPVFVERGLPSYVFRVVDPESLVKPHSRLLVSAERVWRLKPDGTVSFIKHRKLGIMNSVDLKEFFLVQLQAMPYNKNYD